MSRQRQFVSTGCSRSFPILSRPPVDMCERPLSPSPTFSAARAKVNSQGRPVAHRENRRRLLSVGTSRPIAADLTSDQLSLTPAAVTLTFAGAGRGQK